VAQPEDEIALEVALVELVEDDRAHPAQLGVAAQALEHHALGRVDDARARRRLVVEADAVPDLFAQRTAALGGDATRGAARGQAARLEDPDLPLGERVGDRGRDLGGLAGARRRLDDDDPDRAERVEDRGQDRADRQIGGRRAAQPCAFLASAGRCRRARRSCLSCVCLARRLAAAFAW
jgi:hypothetical protein